VDIDKSKGLVRFEFMEVIVRIAKFCYCEDLSMSLTDGVSKLFSTFIFKNYKEENANSSWQKWSSWSHFRKKLHTLEVNDLFITNLDECTSLYKRGLS
jgi:hypothetical protein